MKNLNLTENQKSVIATAIPVAISIIVALLVCYFAAFNLNSLEAIFTLCFSLFFVALPIFFIGLYFEDKNN